MIKIEDSFIKISDECVGFLQSPIENFDKSLLKVGVSNNETPNFQILFSISYDKINYGEYVVLDELELPVDSTIPVYIGINFKPIIKPNLRPTTLYGHKNVDNTDISIVLESIEYNLVQLDITSKEIIRFQTIYQIINEFPKWNFYDNQDITVKRWLAQCNSIAEMYGYICIWFKTESIDELTKHTLANNVIRNVTNIKKIHIQFQENNIPNKNIIYTEWDMPTDGDIIIDVVKDKFEQAFGLKNAPSVKDYIYVPFLNRLFRVNGCQPKLGLMGKIGWWEVTLGNYEDDDCVSINDELKNVMSGLPGMDDAFNSLDDLVDEDSESVSSEVFNQMTQITNDTVISKEKIEEKTIDEKKIPTQNLTNKLVDSTFYVSLKETDKLREYYDSRLKIVSVNPDTSAVPITMYDNSVVGKRVIAMQYCLKDYNTKNKLNLSVDTSFEISMNFVLMNNFVGEVIDILGTGGIFSYFTIKCNRNRFEIIDNRNQQTYQLNFQLQQKEIYNISIQYTSSLKQYAVKIFSLVNKEKSLEYQQIYINNQIDETNLAINFEYIHLFGGSFLSSEINLTINQKNILNDIVNPLLKMNNQ